MEHPTKAGFWKRIKLSLKQPNNSVIYRTSDGVWFHDDLNKGVLERPEYRNFEHLQHYAMLSAHVYEKDQHSAANEDIKIPQGCKLIADESDIKTTNQNHKSVKGLRYQVWHWGEQKQMIIVFRGSGKRLGDWFSNFRWATRFIPGVDDHYDLVRDNINAIIESGLSRTGPIDQIISTGHSLGGGLAQQAAYSCKDIKTVYAFNPTPITGYKNIEHEEIEENRQNIFIARIFEHGEVLAYMRFGLRAFYKISAHDPTIIELRFNFSKKLGPFREHGMLHLAQQVWKTAAKTGTLPAS